MFFVKRSQRAERGWRRAKKNLLPPPNVREGAAHPEPESYLRCSWRRCREQTGKASGERSSGGFAPAALGGEAACRQPWCIAAGGSGAGKRRWQLQKLFWGLVRGWGRARQGRAYLRCWAQASVTYGDKRPWLL